jgi:hypothetical protein
MPVYKLIYFKSRGRGEMIRLAFAAAGVKYEDCRLTREEFEELKASKFKYIITGCFKTLQLYFKCYFIHICSQ